MVPIFPASLWLWPSRLYRELYFWRGFEWMYSHFYQHTLPATDIIAHYAAGEPKAVAHVERFMDVLAVCLGNLLTMLGSPFGRGGWGVV